MMSKSNSEILSFLYEYFSTHLDIFYLVIMVSILLVIVYFIDRDAIRSIEKLKQMNREFEENKSRA